VAPAHDSEETVPTHARYTGARRAASGREHPGPASGQTLWAPARALRNIARRCPVAWMPCLVTAAGDA
jgi:hypothetical protein